jgi:lipid-binding SYLF domain-containing protein
MEIGKRPKFQQEALQRTQHDVQMEGGMTGTQVGVNDKAVVIVLFMS